MAIIDFFSDLIASVGLQEAHAEGPTDGEEEKAEEGSEQSNDAGAGENGDEDEGAGEEEGGEEAEEEEEEEDDEPVDLKPKLEEECMKSAQCAPYKHHYDECVERVTAVESDEEYKGPREDCVEEFFHLQHCATACAAPKLFKALK